jgi:hypothetical protein
MNHSLRIGAVAAFALVHTGAQAQVDIIRAQSAREGMRDTMENVLDLAGKAETLADVGWQAMLRNQTKPACDYWTPRISFGEESLLASPGLFQAYSKCCRQPELRFVAVSRFITKNANLLSGTKAPGAVKSVMKLIAEQAVSGRLDEDLKAQSHDDIKVLLEFCPVVVGTYERSKS